MHRGIGKKTFLIRLLATQDQDARSDGKEMTIMYDNKENCITMVIRTTFGRRMWTDKKTAENTYDRNN